MHHECFYDFNATFDFIEVETSFLVLLSGIQFFDNHFDCKIVERESYAGFFLTMVERWYMIVYISKVCLSGQSKLIVRLVLLSARQRVLTCETKS